MADYNALFQAPNAGASFAQAFQQGQQQRRVDTARQAMAVLTRDPSNQRALEALASVDPASAQQFQQQRIEMAKQQLAQHQENIFKGAQIIRQLQPKDQAGWDQARAVAGQAGIDLSEVPAQFDPQYVQGIVSIADAFKPQDTTPPPSSIREFEFAKQNGFRGAYTDFLQFVHPPSAVTVPFGATVSAPGASGGLPAVATPEEAMKLPPGTQFQLPDGRIGTVPGGAGGNASGGFPQ